MRRLDKEIRSSRNGYGRRQDCRHCIRLTRCLLQGRVRTDARRCRTCRKAASKMPSRTSPGSPASVVALARTATSGLLSRTDPWHASLAASATASACPRAAASCTRAPHRWESDSTPASCARRRALACMRHRGKTPRRHRAGSCSVSQGWAERCHGCDERCRAATRATRARALSSPSPWHAATRPPPPPGPPTTARP